MDAAASRRVEEQRIALLYGNSLAVSATALLIAALLAVIAWPHAAAERVFTWCGTVLIVQGAVQWLAHSFHKDPQAASRPDLWGRRLTVVAVASGIVWGAAVFVLVEPGDTLTLSLISACLAARATVSILTHSYHPPALYAFVVPIFGLLTVRFALGDDHGNFAMALMWLAVLAYVLLFVNHQARVVAAQILLRCENEQLVVELKRQNALAEDARRRAEEASRSKSRFFAAANHDLRQPLHSLGLFATALRSGSVDESGRQMIDQILQCTESLEQLFDNLLDISRLDAGQIEVKPETVPSNAVLNRLRSTFVDPAKNKGLTISVRGSRVTLNTDSTLLFRVLSNFVSNAIRYTDNGGIVVGVRRRGNVAHIEVWDTGVGISPEQHDRIFEEFYQLANPERDRKQGLGLGLATVKRIAQLLEHPIRVRSTPGKGSRFTIEVPIADPARIQSIAATIEQKVPNLLGNKLIVVIDDEATVRLGMQSLLESWGCKCVTAMDAAEALQGINGRAPDFIIADLRLRGSDTGIEAIRTLRSTLGDGIPAVLISGDTAAEQLRRVSAAGLTMMHKPLKAVRLRALLNHEFAKRLAPQ